MSTYRGYCQGQAIECARRARMASTPAVAEHYRELGKHWLKLAAKERAKARLKGTTADGRSRGSAGEPVDEPHALAGPARAGASPAARLRRHRPHHRGVAGRVHLCVHRCKLWEHSAPPDGGQ
jgi:hypothetical protein